MVYLKLVLVMLFWGGTFIATRLASQVFEPFLGASIRYLIATALLLPMSFRSNRLFYKVTKAQFFRLMGMGITGIFFYNYFFFKGLKLVPASHGALLVALNPSMVLLLSVIWHKEKINFIKMAGILVSLFGVVLVISRGHVGQLFSNFSLGDAFMLGCPVAWAFYTMIGREVMKKSSPIEAAAWSSFTGLVWLALFSLTEPLPAEVSPKIWIALFYLGIVGTVIAFTWYNEGIKKLGPTRTSIFNNLVPVFAVILSVLILHETVSWYTWLGGLLVIGGVLLTNRF